MGEGLVRVGGGDFEGEFGEDGGVFEEVVEDGAEGAGWCCVSEVLRLMGCVDDGFWKKGVEWEELVYRCYQPLLLLRPSSRQ